MPQRAPAAHAGQEGSAAAPAVQDSADQSAEQRSQPDEHIITFTEVVLGPEWAGINASRVNPADNQASPAAVPTAEDSTQLAGGVTTAGSLSTQTHFVVRQPDGALDVGVNVARMDELKQSAAAEVASQRAAFQQEARAAAAAPDQVVALQGAEHTTFQRRRRIFVWLMVIQFLLYIALLALCITSTHRFFVGNADDATWSNSTNRRAWLRDFAFAFSNAEAECISDMIVILAATAAAFLGAALCRPVLLTAALSVFFLVFALGAAAVLSPLIILRLIVLALGVSVRTGMLRWRPAAGHEPFLRQLRGGCASCWQQGTALLCCCCQRRQGQQDAADVEMGDVTGNPSAAAAARVVRPSPPALLRRSSQQAPQLDRNSVSLQLGDFVHSTGQTRELLWNSGTGLERNSPILQNASRARVSVDANGRRVISMSGLGVVSSTRSGNQSYR